MNFEIDLNKLGYKFGDKPLLIGGKAMEYYSIRTSKNDIDLIVSKTDHEKLVKKFPNDIKVLDGDIGICKFEFEFWNQICKFDYNYLKYNAIEEKNYLVISLEKLIFLKAILMKKPKNLKDLELIVDKVLEKVYGNTFE